MIMAMQKSAHAEQLTNETTGNRTSNSADSLWTVDNSHIYDYDLVFAPQTIEHEGSIQNVILRQKAINLGACRVLDFMATTHTIDQLQGLTYGIGFSRDVTETQKVKAHRKDNTTLFIADALDLKEWDRFDSLNLELANESSFNVIIWRGLGALQQFDAYQTVQLLQLLIDRLAPYGTLLAHINPDNEATIRQLLSLADQFNKEKNLQKIFTYDDEFGLVIRVDKTEEPIDIELINYMH